MSDLIINTVDVYQTFFFLIQAEQRYATGPSSYYTAKRMQIDLKKDNEEKEKKQTKNQQVSVLNLWEAVIIILSHFFSKLQILLLPLPAFL